MEESIMEKSEQTEQIGQSVDEPVSSRSNTFYGNDSALPEKFLLEEMDSYWEDLRSRLTVSRMVSESVIKGMVNAVAEEASEEIASKEVVIAILNQKLRLCQANALGMDEGCRRSSDASANEQLWEDELEREITGIIFCDFVRNLQDEFERKLEQRSVGEKSSHNCCKKVDELSTISQQLKTILEFYRSSEFGFLEGLEDRSISKKRDRSPWKVLGNHHSTHGSRNEENGDESIDNSKELREDMHLAFPLLKSMNKEEVIDFFKNEITSMKMQHDKALQEKTEEVFSLKRELLKEKGSTHPFQFRKDKETELTRKNIFNLISKLDDVLLQDEKLTSTKYEQESLNNLKEKTDSLLENQRLQDLIADREKDADGEKQISDYSSTETGYLGQIRELELHSEDIQIESFIRGDTQKTVLKELLRELKMDIHGFEMESKMQQEFNSFVHKSILESTISSIRTALLNSYEEKNSIKAALLEKENALFSEIEDRKKLKRALDSFSELVREKELLASGMESKLMQQKGQLDIALCEIDILRDKVNEQDLYISERKREFNLMVCRLEETLQNARHYEARLNEANQKLKDISDSVQEAEKQKNLLTAVIAEKQNALVSAAAKDEEHEKWTKSITVFMQEFSKSLVDCESRLVNYLEYIESRFLTLKDQFNRLVKQAKFVKRKTQWYKELFEISSSNLRKAESEVDLLGDEADVLTHLLDKVYVALDHYSSVLQHYPGVVDALEMIRTYLKGNHK